MCVSIILNLEAVSQRLQNWGALGPLCGRGVIDVDVEYRDVADP